MTTDTTSALPAPYGWIFDGSPNGFLRFQHRPLEGIASLVHSVAPVYSHEQMRAALAAAPPEAAPAVPAWQPIGTVDLSALDGPVWLALVGGQVMAGEYKWRQGRNPDGFNTAGCGRFGLHEVTHCMPYSTPQHPAAAPQPQPEAPTEEPFGYFRATPCEIVACAETDEGAFPLYERPAGVKP